MEQEEKRNEPAVEESVLCVGGAVPTHKRIRLQ